MAEPLQKITAVPRSGDGYADLERMALALFEGERDFLANMANLSSLLYHELGDVNWAGFYLNRAGELVLGPFQGKVACVRIAWGKGVCGTSAAQRRTLVVPDVHAFPGHIACDPASRSEVVVPMIGPSGEVLGVLDVDSPTAGRFDAVDGTGLERLVSLLLDASDLEPGIPASADRTSPVAR